MLFVIPVMATQETVSQKYFNIYVSVKCEIYPAQTAAAAHRNLGLF